MPSPSADGSGSAGAGACGACTFRVGDCVKGCAKAVNDFGVFLDVGASKEAFLPWHQVVGSGPAADEILNLVVASLDDKGRLTLATPGSEGRPAALGGKGRAGAGKPAIGGFIYDTVLGVRPRRKGGKGDKGDGRGAYTYPDGLSNTDLLPDDDVSGHVTNIERGGCWIDIGATKDAFISWTDAPRSSSRWSVGDLIDDLKIKSVSSRMEDIQLKWDDEGISSLTDKQWEQLFIAGPSPPPPKKEDDGPATGDNCCALYGNAPTAAPGNTAISRSADEEWQPPPPAAGAEDFRKGGSKGSSEWAFGGKGGKGGGSADFAHLGGKGLGGRATWGGRASGRGKGKPWSGVNPTIGRSTGWDASKGSSEGPKGSGKGEGPAYADADGHGSCAAPAEARARSAPPPPRQRLRPIEDVSVGEVVHGRVTGLSRAGALVDFGCEAEGLVPRVLLAAECHTGQVIPRLSVIGADAGTGRVTLEPLDDE